MKKALMAGVVALALLLVGCGGPSKDATYLDAVNSRAYFQPVSNELLLDTGYAVCEAMDNGATIGDVLMVVALSDIDPYEGGWLAGAAVGALCPEHKP